jgi:hypothetical protein
MRKMRIVLGLLAVAILVLGVAGPASAAMQFTDIKDHNYEASITNLASRDFIGGYADNTFRPDNPLQRQQFAKMAVLTLGLPVTAANVSQFPDTPAPSDPVTNPLYPGSYVAVAAANSIIQGYANGNFGFYDNVTRQQVITMVVRAAGAALTEAPADYAGVLSYTDPNHGANIKKAEYNGMLAGIADLTTWDLTANATRGEAAELLSQLFYRTGKLVKITGSTGTVELSMAELKAMTATEGFGGTKNKVGTVTAPKLYKGVAIKDLMALVGGGTTVKVVATDGYESSFTADEVNGVVTMYNPATGEPVTTIVGTVTMILCYSVDGAPLLSSDGALRIGLVSQTADQVTDAKKWARSVASITVQ